MPGPSYMPQGNVLNIFTLQPTLTFTPTTIAGTTGSEVTATVNGVQTGDFVFVNKPTTQTNVGIDNVRVSANNVIAIAFANNSTATQTPTNAEVYTVLVVRNSNPSSIPAAVE